MVVDLQGAYLTGALRLTDCVHLQLPAGVTLLAGDKVSGSGLLSITTGREINPARVNRARGVMQRLTLPFCHLFAAGGLLGAAVRVVPCALRQVRSRGHSGSRNVLHCPQHLAPPNRVSC